MLKIDLKALEWQKFKSKLCSSEGLQDSEKAHKTSLRRILILERSLGLILLYVLISSETIKDFYTSKARVTISIKPLSKDDQDSVKKKESQNTASGSLFAEFNCHPNITL